MLPTCLLFTATRLQVVELLLGVNTQFLDEGSQFLQVGLVLSLVLNLFLDSLQYPHGSSVIVDLAGGLEDRGNDVGRGDHVVGETVVETSLKLKDILDVFEKGLVTGIE